MASVIPAQDSAGVSVETKLKVVFTEKVRRDQAERLIILSPSSGRLFFNWQGKAVELKPEKLLRPEITYRISVEPGLADLHGVKSEKRFVSFFSTGKTFSPGRIEGIVAWRDSLIAGARLTARNLIDTTLSFTAETDSGGSYLFPYLPFGAYRIESYRDRNRNGRFDFTREEGADSLVALVFEPLKINFKLILADTTAPFLASVETPDSVTVILSFDDRLHPAQGIAKAGFELRTPDSVGQVLSIDTVYLDSTDSRRVILHPSRPLMPETSYYVAASGIVNEAGLEMLPGRAKKVFRYRQQEAKSVPVRRAR